MRQFAFALLFLCLNVPSALADGCSKEAVTPLLNTLFSSLGNDCDTYASLFSENAKYYHQHDGYKDGSELLQNCQAYHSFCPGKPGNDCKFRQNGEAEITARGESCHLLVPYIWSEMPANHEAKGNLEPHTGFEYIVVSQDEKSQQLRMDYFAEIESSYSVAFDWSKPAHTPGVVKKSTVHLLSLPNSKSQHECDNPIAPVLTKYFSDKSVGSDTWRQQGDAVVLASGGICHVSVPYAAQVGDELKSGHVVFTLQPGEKRSYRTLDTVEFSQ